MSAVVSFARFEVGRLARSWKFLIITVGFPVVFYMLFLGDRNAGRVINGTVTWRVYLMISMSSFGALVAALTAGARLAGERASGWTRQLRVTPISASSYLSTKVVASMLVVLPVIALVELVGALFGGVHLGAGMWLELTAVLWVTSLPLAILGVFVGSMVNTETAFPIVTTLMFVLGYFGGLFNPVSSMPSGLRTAAHLLPNFHHASLALDLVDGHGVGVDHWLVLAVYTVVLGLAVVARHGLEERQGLV